MPKAKQAGLYPNPLQEQNTSKYLITFNLHFIMLNT